MTAKIPEVREAMKMWLDSLPNTFDDYYLKNMIKSIVDVLEGMYNSSFRSSSLPEGYVLISDWKKIPEGNYVSGHYLKTLATTNDRFREMCAHKAGHSWCVNPVKVKEFFLHSEPDMFRPIKKRLRNLGEVAY